MGDKNPDHLAADTPDPGDSYGSEVHNLAPGISDLGIPDGFEEDKLVTDMPVPGSSGVSEADSLGVHNHAPGSDVCEDGLGDDIPVLCSFAVFEEDSLAAHTPVLCSFAVFDEDSLAAHTPVPGGSGMVEADKLVAHIPVVLPDKFVVGNLDLLHDKLGEVD